MFTVHASPEVTRNEVEETYELACNAMIGVCFAVNEALGGIETGERLWILGDSFRELSNKSKAERDTVEKLDGSS